MRESIREKFPGTIQWLDEIPHKTWALYVMEEAGAKTYMQKTSNYVESANSALMPVRAEAPLKAVEMYVNKLVDMAAEAAEASRVMKEKCQVLTDLALAEYKELETLSDGCRVQKTASPSQAYVTTDRTRGSPERMVDFVEKTCTCLKWQQTGRPCHHAIACYKQNVLGVDLHKGMDWWVFAWDACYHVRTYATAVDNANVVKPQRLTLVPDKTTKIPNLLKQRGRPKVKRMRRAGEGGRPARKRKEYTCTECGGTGHTRSTCDNPRAAILIESD
jgi:hypothetical protein